MNVNPLLVPAIEMARVMHFVYFIGSITMMFFLGRFAHEGTHWLVAWLLGADVKKVEMTLWSGHIEYEMAADKPLLYDRIINLSPQLIGILVGVPYMLWLISEGVDVLLLYVMAELFIVYAGMGGAADYSMAVAQGDGRLWKPDPDETVAFVSLAMVVLSIVSMFVNPSGGFIVYRYVRHLDIALMFGGLFLLFAWFAVRREEIKA